MNQLITSLNTSKKLWRRMHCVYKALIGVGFPARILKNCVHYVADTLDVEKIYQYFHIYTVHTENLKEHFEFVDIEYRSLLSHSKTQWLSLFPGIERRLRMFLGLKAFFLSLEKNTLLDQEVFWRWVQWDLPLAHALCHTCIPVTHSRNGNREQLNCGSEGNFEQGPHHASRTQN